MRSQVAATVTRPPRISVHDLWRKPHDKSLRACIIFSKKFASRGNWVVPGTERISRGSVLSLAEKFQPGIPGIALLVLALL